MTRDKEAAIRELRELQRSKAVQDRISDAELNARFEKAKKFAMKTEQTDGQLYITFIAHLRRRTHDPALNEWLEIPMVFPDWPPEDKYETLRGLGHQIATDFPDYMVVCVVQFAEAWMATYKPDEVSKDSPYVPEGTATPGQRPDKLEVLIVDAMTIDQRPAHAMIPIIRKSNGDFGTWGQEHNQPYDPYRVSSSDATNYLLMQFFMGSTSVAKEGAKT